MVFNPTLLAPVNVGGNPVDLCYDGNGCVWVSNTTDNTVTRMRRDTGAVVGTYTTGGGPKGVVAAGSFVWVCNSSDNTVSKLTLAGATVGVFACGGTSPQELCFDGENIWTANSGSNNVSKIRISDGAVVGTYGVGTSPFIVCFDGTYVWSANSGSNNVTKLLASTGAAAGTFAVGASPIGICWDGAYIWVAATGANLIQKVNPSTGAVIGSLSAAAPFLVCSDGVRVWATLNGTDTVVAVNRGPITLAATVTLGGGLVTNLAFDEDGGIWVAVTTLNRVARVRIYDAGASLASYPWIVVNEPLTTTLSGATFGTYGVGRGPAGICADSSGAVWVCDYNDATVTKLDGVFGGVLGVFPVGTNPEGACYDAVTGTVWVANYADDTVTKLALDGTVLGTFAVGDGPSSCVAVGANIFVANSNAGTVTKLLASTGAAVGSPIAVGAFPQAICVDAAGLNVWTANLSGNTLTKILASTGAVVGTYAVGTAPSSVFAAGPNIWCVNSGAGTATKLLASTGGAIGTYSVGSGTPQAGCFDGVNVWVTNLISPAGTITALLESSGAIRHTFPCGDDPDRVCYDGNNGLWISDFVGNTVTRLSAFVGGPTDQTGRLDTAAGKLTFNSMLRRRGTATIPFYIDASDTSGPGGSQYAPTEGSPVYLSDLTPSSVRRVYAGKFNDITTSCIDNTGNLRLSMSCVSLESCFDTILVNARIYENTTCGAIFADLFALATGSPVTLGVVDAGATLAKFVVSNFPKISDLFDQLATASSYVWGVDPSDSTAFFHAPSAVDTPFDLQTSDLQFASFNVKKDLRDYRNRQLIQTSYDAFAHSSELFANSDMVSLPQGPSSFRLMRPVNQVTNAWYTYNTQSTASGTFSGQPNPGDAIEITFPQSGSVYNWRASVCPSSPSFYALGQIIIDPNGHVQKVTTGPGYAGLTQPVWSTDGGFVTDGPPPCQSTGITWTDQGVQGFANNDASVYVFVTALDNTQWGQVLIGATLTETIRNFVDALNALDTTNTQAGGSASRGRGVTFSWPTWENPLVNGDRYTSGSVIHVRNKPAGAQYVAALNYTPVSSTQFAWSAPYTSGGQTKFNTSICPVGLYGTLATSGLAYQPGSDVVSLSFPLGLPPNVGLLLQVEYTRADGDSITVENTAEVALRAAIEHSSGKYQQRMTANPAWTNIQALAQVQAVLAAYCVVPQTFAFVTARPGILGGYLLTITLATPAGFAALVNGGWCVTEVNAEWLPKKPWIDQALAPPGSEYGHFRYTARVVDVAQIGDFVDFWRGLGGGSSTGSAVVVGGSQASGALSPLNPGQIYAVEQSQIAGLGLGTADNPTMVIVKDYSHMLIWTGTSFQFADGGSNYYVFSDHVPSPGSPAVQNGWAPCDGSTVNYLLGDGTLASKTLPNLTGGSYFLELGTGTGATHSEVLGTVTGSASGISGSVSSTGTVSGVTISGTVNVSGVTVHGNVNGAVVTLSDVSGHVHLDSVTNWVNAGHISLSGVSVSLSGVDIDLSGVTVDNDGLGDLSVDMTGLEISTSTTGVSVNSNTTGISDLGHDHDVGFTTTAISDEEGSVEVVDFVDSPTGEGFANIHDPGHIHIITDTGHSHNGLGVLDVAGTPGLTGDTSFSGSGSLSGTPTASTSPDDEDLVFVSGAGSVTSSSFTQTSISGSATWSQSGTGSGTCSTTGSFSGASGSISGVSTGGKPPRVSMQAWFRL